MARGIRQGIIADRFIASFTLAAGAVMLGFLALAFFLRVELQLWGNGIVYADSPHEVVAELYMDIGRFSSVSPGQKAVLVLGGGDTFSGKVLSRSISPGPGSGSPVLIVSVGEFGAGDEGRLLSLVRREGKIPLRGRVLISEKRRLMEVVVKSAFRKSSLSRM